MALEDSQQVIWITFMVLYWPFLELDRTSLHSHSLYGKEQLGQSAKLLIKSSQKVLEQ